MLKFKLKDVFDEKIKNIKGTVIYCIRDVKTNKRFIGSTKNSLFTIFNDLGESHRNRVGKLKLNNGLYIDIYNNINNFVVEILEVVKSQDERVIEDRTQYFIDKYNPEYNVVKNVSDRFSYYKFREQRKINKEISNE